MKALRHVSQLTVRRLSGRAGTIRQFSVFLIRLLIANGERGEWYSISYSIVSFDANSERSYVRRTDPRITSGSRYRFHRTGRHGLRFGRREIAATVRK